MQRWSGVVAGVSALVIGAVTGLSSGALPEASAAPVPAPVVPVKGAVRDLAAGAVGQVVERSAPVKPTGDFGDAPGIGLPMAAGAAPVPPAPARGAKVLTAVPRAEVDKLPVIERGEKFTVFDAGGGARIARLSAGPVNAKDARGQWVPIDESLQVDASGRLSPKASSDGVSFAPSAGARDLVRAGGPGHRMVLGLEGAADRSGVIDGSAITYSSVMPGVDLEFRSAPALVKTTVVLAKAPAPKEASWRFPLTVEAGVTPSLAPTGGVVLTDRGGRVVASVPTPVMWDSNADKASGDPGVYGPVSVSLAGDADTGWVLVLSADEKWLADPARVFPVHVDPTVYYQPGLSGILCKWARREVLTRG